MTKSKSMKRALLMSILSLLMCVSMLVGTTFAWFTDEVTSSGNKIQAGTLRIDLLHLVDGEWISLKHNSEHKVFDYDLWEPGYTQVETLKIANMGTLALQYQMNVVAEESTPILGTNGENLADVIDVYMCFGEANAASFNDIANGTSWWKMGTLAELMASPEGITQGKMLPVGSTYEGESLGQNGVMIGECTASIALHMQETAGNEYQNLSLGNLYINLNAIQYTFEEDTFGDQYDANAQYPQVAKLVVDAAALKAALEAGESVKLGADITMPEALLLDSDVTLDLNGYKITTGISNAIAVNANVILNGVVPGSGITAVAADNNEANLFDVISGSLQINGGTYSVTTKNAGTAKNQAEVIHVSTGASLVMSDAVVTATNAENGSVVGVLADEGSVVDLTNTNVTVSSGLGLENVGVYSKADVKLSNCEIVAKAHYTANEAGNDYASHSRGVYCEGKLEMYDSYVWGSHAGVTAKGDVYVDGGTYEGYGHGGIYFAGNDSTSYIYNASINWAEMKEGTYADEVAGTNGAGMYVGGASGMTIYMDNCDIYGTYYGIVLRNSSGEKNNKVYISHSEFTGCSRYAFRIRSGKNTAYSGVGNVYPGATNDSSLGNFIETTESYAPEAD